MHIAICDDSYEEILRIIALLEKYRLENKHSITYETFQNAIDLLESMKERHFDILLLDIVMPGFTGMDAAKEVRMSNEQVPIIFMTSSKEFAVESYRVKATDYILKPIISQELFPTLDKLNTSISKTDYITVKTSDRVNIIPISHIIYVEVQNRTIRFVLKNNDVQCAYGYLVDYEKDLLAFSSFIKTHRSFIVNMQEMISLDKSGFIAENGDNIPVARGLFTQIKSEYMKFLLSGRGDR